MIGKMNMEIGVVSDYIIMDGMKYIIKFIMLGY